MFRGLLQKIKIFLEKAGNFQARLLFTFVYVIFVIPMGLLMKLFSDPLRLRHQAGSAWILKKLRETDPDGARRQF